MNKPIEKTSFIRIMTAMFYFTERGFETFATGTGFKAVRGDEIWKSKTLADSTIEMRRVEDR